MDSSMAYPHLVAISGFCLFTLSVGLISLVWPERMQRHALKHGTKFYFWPNPFLGWMQTRSYRVYLRIMGVVFLLAGAKP
jgi:hypothetical protein